MFLRSVILGLQGLAIMAADYFREDEMNSGFIFVPSVMKASDIYKVEDCLAKCVDKNSCNLVTFDLARRLCRGYKNLTETRAFISRPGTKVWTNDRRMAARFPHPSSTWIEDPSRNGLVFSPTSFRNFHDHLDDCVEMCHDNSGTCDYLTFKESDMDCRAFVGVADFNTTATNSETWIRAQFGRELESDTSYYLVVKTLMSRDDANTYCERDGIYGHLLKINNAIEQDFFDNNGAFDSGTTTTMWMDAMASSSQNDRWIWNTGRPEIQYSNYESNEPNNPTTEKCLAMNKNTGEWSSEDCSATMHFVCEMDKYI